MFFFLLFASFAYSIESTVETALYDVYRLSPFFFSENGSVSISIKTFNYTKYRVALIFLTKSDYNEAFKTGFINLSLINSTLQPKYNFIISSENGNNHLKFNITERNLYFPCIINCGLEKKYQIAINYNFSNGENQHVDERKKDEFMFYYGLCLLYSILFIIWLINGFIYMKFSVYLHTLCFIQTIFKALSSYFIARSLYILQTLGTDDSHKNIHIFILFFNRFLIAFFHSLVSSGLFILRDQIMKSEVFNIIKCSLLYAISSISLFYCHSFISLMLYFGFSVLSFLLIAKIHIVYWIIIKDVFSNETMKKIPLIEAKFVLYKKCLNTHIFFFITTYLTYFLFSLSNEFSIFANNVVEIISFSYYIIQMRLFMFRYSYVGKPSKIQKNQHFYYARIIDPTQSSVGFLIQAKKHSNLSYDTS